MKSISLLFFTLSFSSILASLPDFEVYTYVTKCKEVTKHTHTVSWIIGKSVFLNLEDVKKGNYNKVVLNNDYRLELKARAFPYENKEKIAIEARLFYKDSRIETLTTSGLWGTHLQNSSGSCSQESDLMSHQVNVSFYPKEN